MTLPIPTHVATFGDFMVLDFEGCSQRSYGRFEIRDGRSGRTIGAFETKARAVRYARGNAASRAREALSLRVAQGVA